jgi:hypothetical protein
LLYDWQASSSKELSKLPICFWDFWGNLTGRLHSRSLNEFYKEEGQTKFYLDRRRDFFWQANAPGGPSSCLPLLLVLHPFADQIWAAENAEVPPLAAHEIHERVTVQFLQMNQVK